MIIRFDTAHAVLAPRGQNDNVARQLPSLMQVRVLSRRRTRSLTPEEEVIVLCGSTDVMLSADPWERSDEIDQLARCSLERTS